MNGLTLRKTVLITNPEGFHMRPATRFVTEAQKFRSSVYVIKGDRRINGKEPFQIMLVLTPPEGEITIEVTGEDAQEALSTLVKVVNEPASESKTPPVP